MSLQASLIQPVHATQDDLIGWVAACMRLTLMEVLGESQGKALYSLDWLEQRVRFHLQPELCVGQVFLASGRRPKETENSLHASPDCAKNWPTASLADGQPQGYTIVRQETPEVGLFSTTYVDPRWRRQGVAGALLTRGEAWMRQQGLNQAVTYTAEHNHKLQQLFLSRGYRLQPDSNGFVQLFRML